MSDSGSFESPFESLTPIFDEPHEETSTYSPIPLQNFPDMDLERPIRTKNEGATLDSDEISQYAASDVSQPSTTNTTGDKPKRKFLRKGEGIARFTPGGRPRKKPVIKKQQPTHTSKEEPMKRVVANRTTETVPPKPVKKTMRLHEINTPQQQQNEIKQSKGISPIPFTPPSYMMGTPINTKMHEFQTPPLSIEKRPKTVSFKPTEYDAVNPPVHSPSNLFRVPSDDSVLLGFMRNEIQQQEDLKEFEALEALIEAHVNGETSLDFDFTKPMDSPAFHALGKKAQQHFAKKQHTQVHTNTNIASPLSVANSSAYQNPLNDARFEDEDGWADVFGDELQQDFVREDETRIPLPENVKHLPPIPYNANNYESHEHNEETVPVPKKVTHSEEVSKLMQERVEELENEITEYQRLNAMIRREEEERKRLYSEYKQKIDEFDEYKKSELERMEKDYQNQMLVVKRERQRLEQYKHAQQTSESKLLKQEIEIMRDQLVEFQGMNREKEAKHKSIVQRLKDNIRQVEFERDELKEQNKLLENLRLKQWEASTENINTNNTRPKHARAKLEFDRASYISNEGIAWTQSRDMEESTQIFSDTSSESCNEDTDLIEPSTFGIINESETSKSYVNSTPIPGHVEKLSERILPDKSTEILYFNNTRKVISPSGKMVTLYLSNGDIKTMTEGKTIYLYSENGTKHTKFIGGKEIFEYSSGQREIMNTDGSKEMFFPDGNKAVLFADGSEKVTCKDGTVQKKSADGNTTVIWHPDGFVDTMTTEYKKREFEDGTCKIVFRNGTHETRYPSGRVRIKNAKGEVIHDEIMDK